MLAVILDWNSRLLDLRELLILLPGAATLGGLVIYAKKQLERLGTFHWPMRQRTAQRRLRQLRWFHANPRLLVAYIARRIVGVAIIGSAILLNDALYASDHIRALSGHPMNGLRWELLMAALTRLIFVSMIALGGADTVERMDDWAEYAKARKRLLARCRKRR